LTISVCQTEEREYATAFSDIPKARIFRVPPVVGPTKPLVVPAWMWNSQEWSAFAHAAPGIQRPLLLQALRELRSGSRISEPVERRIRRRFGFCETSLRSCIAQSLYAGWPHARNCGGLLRNIATDANTYLGETTGLLHSSLDALQNLATSIANARHWQGANSEGYNDFSETELISVVQCLVTVLESLPQLSELAPVSEDAPVKFEVGDLADHLNQIGDAAGGGQVLQFIATLQMRIEMLLADARLGIVINPQPNNSISLEQWLGEYLGENGAANGPLAILDLSLVSSDVLHIVIAVVARVIFEAIQRYRRLYGAELPTVLILEEAHNFIRRGEDTDEGFITAAQMCRQTFERIAREGRKFGLGLLLASQRPSELSPTVLAQCNTFLLHRLVNDEDQKLVSRLLPDNLGSLLKELPSLPSRQAILLGWATPVPVMVEINELPYSQRPKSADPKFWEVWTGQETRSIEWNRIVQDWAKVPTPAQTAIAPASIPSNSNNNQAAPSTPSNPEEDDVPF
jgi:uncharacterized protein